MEKSAPIKKACVVSVRMSTELREAVTEAASKDRHSISQWLSFRAEDALEAAATDVEAEAADDLGAGRVMTKTIRLPEGLWQAIDEYHHDRRMASENAAIRRLIAVGLRTVGKRTRK